MITISIIDETMSSTPLNTLDISFNSEEITLNDVVISRVEMEVERYDSKET